MSLPVIAIAGPTAVGKSDLADELAVRLETDVLSVDSMQVYRSMDIGTAKTPVAERRAPLRLIDLVDASESYSAALYQRDARALVDGHLANGDPVVMCGGTGLYLRAALDDMDFPSGELDDGRRRRLQELAEELGPEGLHHRLAELDPESAAAIHPHNVRRVVRALEMHEEGRSYAHQKDGFSSPRSVYPYRLFCLTMDREALYRRIDRRVDLMFERGLVEEVRGLIEAGAGGAITSRQAIGYKEVMDALAGTLTMDEAADLIKLRSRRYAKRQLSWFRHDPRTEWLDMDALDTPAAAEEILHRVEA